MSKILAMQQRSGGCGGRWGGGGGAGWARSEAAVRRSRATGRARRMNVIVRPAGFRFLRRLDAEGHAPLTLGVNRDANAPIFDGPRNGRLMFAAYIAGWTGRCFFETRQRVV